MIVECGHCGAPLEVAIGNAFADCRYCGRSNRVRSARTLYLERPEGWSPPAAWTPPSEKRASSANALPRRGDGPRRRGRWPAPSLAIGAMALLIGVVPMTLVAVELVAQSGALGLLLPSAWGVDSVVETRQLELTGPPRPVSLRGRAAVGAAATRFAARCRGYVSDMPAVVIDSDRPREVTLRVGGQGDLVMAVRGPTGGTACDDDGGDGTLPLLNLTLEAGRTEVWIGPYSDAQREISYTLSVEPVGGAAVSLLSLARPVLGEVPTLGTVTLPSARSGRITATAYGEVEADEVFGSDCRGSIPSTPQITFVVERATPIDLAPRAIGNTDLVAVLRGPGLPRCDDDGGSRRNPRIRARLDPGVYHLHVGVYHAQEQAEFRLTGRGLRELPGARAPAGRRRTK